MFSLKQFKCSQNQIYNCDCWGRDASLFTKISRIDICHIFDVSYVKWHIFRCTSNYTYTIKNMTRRRKTLRWVKYCCSFCHFLPHKLLIVKYWNIKVIHKKKWGYKQRENLLSYNDIWLWFILVFNLILSKYFEIIILWTKLCFPFRTEDRKV